MGSPILNANVIDQKYSWFTKFIKKFSDEMSGTGSLWLPNAKEKQNGVTSKMGYPRYGHRT